MPILQALCPAVTGVPRRRNCFLGHPISSGLSHDVNSPEEGLPETSKFTCNADFTGVMSRGYRCSSAAELLPRSPHFIWVVHTKGGVIRGYRCLVKRPCPLATVRGSYATLCHSGKNIHLSPRALCRRITLKDDRITTLIYAVGHSFGYRSKKFMCACAKSKHAHGTEFTVGKFQTF